MGNGTARGALKRAPRARAESVWQRPTALAGPQHGLDLLAKAPGGGIVAQVTGVFFPDETHHGIFQIPEDPAVGAVICDALS